MNELTQEERKFCSYTLTTVKCSWCYLTPATCKNICFTVAKKIREGGEL